MIVLPPSDPDAKKMPGAVWKPPRFDFSGGSKKVVRPKKTFRPQNSVEMLQASGISGLKYAHAIVHSSGDTADLEACREAVLNKGTPTFWVLRAKLSFGRCTP